MIYDLDFSELVRQHIAKLKKSDLHAYKKLLTFFAEVREHPETGTGHPKPLGNDRVGEWSRRITDKHRLVYEIDKDNKTVSILSALGHYDDK